MLGTAEMNGGRGRRWLTKRSRSALERWREIRDDAGGADVLRELGVSHLFHRSVQAERFVSEALASYRSSGREGGAAWALQNLAWISFPPRGDIPHAEERLQQSANALKWSQGLGMATVGVRVAWCSCVTTRAGSTKPPRSPSTSRSTVARPATAGPSA